MTRRWLAYSLTNRAPATVRRRKASVAEYLKWLGVNDPLKFKLPGAPQPNPHPLPARMDGVDMLIEAAPSVEHSLLIMLCGKLGLRVSEAVAVKSTDFDPIKRALTVFGKGAKYRVLPVPDDVFDAITAQIEALEGGRERLVPFANSTARTHVRNIAASVGMEGVASHDLRATFATDMYERTKNILVVQQWLGHSSPETTRRYVEVSLDDMRAAL